MKADMLQVVDPHIHLWNLQQLHYPWLADPKLTFGGDNRLLAATYEPAQFLADAQGPPLQLAHPA